MQFGLTNAPASFQRTSDVILTKIKWHTCLVYIDDIIICSNTVKDHIRNVNEILTALSLAGVTLKIKKCRLFSDAVAYLGHIIKPSRLEMNCANTASLQYAKPPTAKSELSSFLCAVNIYILFIPHFTVIAYQLNQLLRRRALDKFELDEDQLRSFRTLIDKLCSQPILALPQPGLPYSVDTDASSYGIGLRYFKRIQTTPASRSVIGCVR